MPVINTTTTTNNTDNNPENYDIFQTVLNTLLTNKSPNQYSEDTRLSLMNYLASHTGYRELDKVDLDKLTTIHAKFSSFYCTEILHSNHNQTIPHSYSQFLKFSKALQDKEEFFHPPYTNHQTLIKTDCETILNKDPQTPNSIVQLTAAATHGLLAGSVNGFSAIAFESAKSKGYSSNQLRLLKASLDVFNSLTIASYASLAAFTENSQQPNEVILEKMWQSFVLSLGSSAGLYALTNGISYFAKSIENKFIKGALNILPLAGNLGLLAKSGNNLKTSAVRLGVNIASASAISAAIQSGWHFFSKRGNTAQNTAPALELSTNRIENTFSPIDETSFSTNENSNNTGFHHYEFIGNASVEDGGYLSMSKESQCDSNEYVLPSPPIPNTGPTTPQSMLYLDNNNYSIPKLPAIPVASLVHTQSSSALDCSGYSRPKPPIAVSSLTTEISVPALPLRNQQFFATGGLDVSVNNNRDDVSPLSADSSHRYSK